MPLPRPGPRKVERKMLPRRTALRLGLAAAAASGVAVRADEAAPTVKTKVNFDVPAGATDCHVHVIPEPANFPFSPGRVYTPPVATATQLLALQHALHLDRVVVVTPSVYGKDNLATLDALRQLGPARARGIAVIDEHASAAELDAMHKAGISGIRLNLETAGVVDPAAAGRQLDIATKQIAGRGWHVEMYTRMPVIAALSGVFGSLPVPILFDHIGGAQASLGVGQPGFAELVALMKSGKVYVTLSGAYRASTLPDYSDVAPLAKALIAANPERLVWGSDWPHPDSNSVPGRKTTDIAPALPVDDGRLLNLLAEWAPDAAVRKAILVDNPKRLIGF
jgi:predicted TIM-barrel fold metal-dependent hydrolase